MSIILIRHGETELNAARVVQPAATPLGARGHRQAAALGRRMAGAGLAAILASDLPRCYQTAEALAAATGLPIATDPVLHERNFGDLRGRPYDTLGYELLAEDVEPPNGESWPVFRERVSRAFGAILARRAGLRGPLAVVTHGLVIRALLEAHLRLPAGVALPERIGNTAVTRFAMDSPFAVDIVNCTRHLEGESSDDARTLAGV